VRTSPAYLAITRIVAFQLQMIRLGQLSTREPLQCHHYCYMYAYIRSRNVAWGYTVWCLEGMGGEEGVTAYLGQMRPW